MIEGRIDLRINRVHLFSRGGGSMIAAGTRLRIDMIFEPEKFKGRRHFGL
jgi:hypothetical protein